MAQDKLHELEREADLQQRKDLSEIMALPAGRRFLLDIIERRCNSHGSGVSWSGSEMYFNQGRRQVGIDLREELKTLAPEAYCDMLVEGVRAAAASIARHKAAEELSERDSPDGPIEEDEL
jgi:hypothetical protein